MVCGLELGDEVGGFREERESAEFTADVISSTIAHADETNVDEMFQRLDNDSIVIIILPTAMLRACKRFVLFKHLFHSEASHTLCLLSLYPKHATKHNHLQAGQPRDDDGGRVL